MHLTNCLHPVHIMQHGEEKIVPCGKCDYCRSVRALGMTERINMEMRSHKFGVFFTLTYAEMNLPKFIYSSENRGFFVPSFDCDLLKVSAFTGTDDCGLFVSAPYLSKGSLELVNNYMNRLGFVPFLRKKDVQDFVKRVRIKINRNKNLKYENKESLQILYAICGEYGPTTFKPHYHGLFLFDNEKLAKEIFEIIHEAWPYGSSRSRFTKSDEKSDYVSKYLNSFGRFPNVFRLKEFHPFLLVSKSKPFGLSFFSKEEVEKVIRNGDCQILSEDSRTHEKSLVPVPSQIERYFFPKFTGIDCIDNRLRARLLGLSMQQTSLYEFIENVKFAINEQSEFLRIPVVPSNLRFCLDYCEDIRNYFYTTFKRRACDFGLDGDKVIDSSIASLFYAGRRLRLLMHHYSINSIDEYLQIYDKYFYNKAQYKLLLQFKLEQIVMHQCPDDLKYIDLKAFNDDCLKTYDMRKVLSWLESDLSHSKARKRKNEYLALHPERNVLIRNDEFIEGF